MSDGDDGSPPADDPDAPPADGDEAGDESAAGTRSPATDPRAPDRENPRRRLLVVGVVVLMLAASVAGVAWALTRSPAEPTEPPQLQFDLATHPDGPPTLSHGGGEPVAAGNLVVAVDGDRATWAELRFGLGPDDSVQAGDWVSLAGVESGDTVAVYYVAGDAEVRLAELVVGSG